MNIRRATSSSSKRKSISWRQNTVLLERIKETKVLTAQSAVARAARKEWGGKDSEELSRALYEIRRTAITPFFNTDDRYIERDFNIFNELYFERRNSYTDPIELCRVTIDPIAPRVALYLPQSLLDAAARLPTCMTATTRSEFCSRSTPTSVRSGLVALPFAITSQSSSATNSAHICERSVTISSMSTPQTLPYQSRRIPPQNFFDRPVKYPRRGPNCGAKYLCHCPL
jgi:hypothetical protein